MSQRPTSSLHSQQAASCSFYTLRPISSKLTFNLLGILPENRHFVYFKAVLSVSFLAFLVKMATLTFLKAGIFTSGWSLVLKSFFDFLRF